MSRMTDPQKRVLLALAEHGPAMLHQIAARAQQSQLSTASTLDALYRRSLATIGQFEHWSLTRRGRSRIAELRTPPPPAPKPVATEPLPDDRYQVTTITGCPVTPFFAKTSPKLTTVAQVLDSALNWMLVAEFQSLAGKPARQRAVEYAEKMNEAERKWEIENGVRAA